MKNVLVTLMVVSVLMTTTAQAGPAENGPDNQVTSNLGSSLPKEYEALEGEAVTLKAKVWGDEEAYRWDFMHAHSNFWLALCDGAEYSGCWTPTLTIAKVSYDRQGIYRLAVTTKGKGSMRLPETRLSIRPKRGDGKFRAILSCPSLANGVVAHTPGQVFELGADAVNGKPPFSIHWFKDGNQLNTVWDGWPGFRTDALESKDQGKYQCQIVDSEGHRVMSESLFVRVNELPSRVDCQKDQIYVVKEAGQTIDASFRPGDHVTFRCWVMAAIGPIQYRWYKQGEPVAIGNSGILKVVLVSAEDVGAYTCYATDLGQ